VPRGFTGVQEILKSSVASKAKASVLLAICWQTQNQHE